MNDLYTRTLLGALLVVNVISFISVAVVTNLFQEVTLIDAGFAAAIGFSDLIALSSQISLPKAAAFFPAGSILKKIEK